MKLLVGLILGLITTNAFADETFVELNQCQKKALRAVQMKANKQFDSIVVMGEIEMIRDYGSVDEVAYWIDVDIGTEDADRYARYKSVVPSKNGLCISSQVPVATYVKML